MIGDHHGRTAGRATLLVRAVDEILGTHRLEPARTICSSLRRRLIDSLTGTARA
jgi:hypothetical protein